MTVANGGGKDEYLFHFDSPLLSIPTSVHLPPILFTYQYALHVL
ncbi:hypothetical protein BLGI_4347 [Brevibacillus laterosporus GI-9]|nr:hypothetical protein BLGI_4347 [Brevibacillus laterosporus GI-9]